MESSKHVKSDSGSSEESDHHQEQVKDDAGTTPKRSYGCNYCKRGFTNAQALGGHMNIHRKDRAKAKQNNQHHATNSSFSKPPNEDHHYVMPSRSCFRPTILGEQEKYYLGSEAQAANYHPPMVSCPNIYPQAIWNEGDFSSHRSSQFFSLDEERAGANLSLRIGSTHTENRVDDQENGEVDLELRLGPDP